MTPPSQPQPHRPADPPSSGSDDLLDELSPIEYQALRWTVRAGDGLSADGQRQLQAWLDADPRHRAAYDGMRAASRAMDALPAQAAAQLRASVVLDNAARRADALLRTSPASLLLPPASPPAPAPPAAASAPRQSAAARAVRRRAMLAWPAAAGLAAVLCAGGRLGWQHWQNQLVFSHQYATMPGQQVSASLSDGSHMLVDAATRASVNLYRNRREVRLHEGQAVFQVEADPERPFTVQASQTRVSVVGTEFAVRHLPSLGEDSVVVSVLHGKVRVATLGHDGTALQMVELAPGQAISASAQGQIGPVAAITREDFASWQQGRLNFENARLATVLAELARYGERHIQLQGEAVAQMRITASIDLKNVGGFLRGLPRALPVRVQENGETVLIRLP